jgi:hypothetical protein
MRRERISPTDEKVNEPLLDPLFQDMVQCSNLLDESDTPFARRAYVRTTFAYFEGFVYWLKGVVTTWVLGMGKRRNEVNLTALYLLSDETLRPNRQGKLESEPNRLPFMNFCAFVLRTAAECFEADPSKFFSDNGWCQMKVALDVRHRITHPKNPEDLSISDEEIDAFTKAHHWLFGCVTGILEAADAFRR